MKLNLLLKDFFNKFSKNRNVKYGLPFISLIILGSFGLKEFTQLRFVKQLISYFVLVLSYEKALL